LTLEWLVPAWPAPSNVRAVCTTRMGGVSVGAYASLNLATHVGDDPAAVAANRQRLRAALALPSEPCWLEQTHGANLVEARGYGAPPSADASFTTDRGRVCAILTADCLPILLCDRQGTMVLAIHAGWRGLLNGIIASTLMRCDHPGADWLAWVGPGISVAAYAVGAELAAEFVAKDPLFVPFFVTRGNISYADLSGLAAHQLRAVGVRSITCDSGCTAADAARFFSYRRDGATGRFASLIWLE
jgi:polyphenol oxidase